MTSKRSEISVAVVVLAAGQGKRMRSELPKVLQPLMGQPMIIHILKRIGEGLPQAPICVVLGHQRDRVEQILRNHPISKNLSLSFVYQEEQRGTGDAAKVVVESAWGQEQISQKRLFLVLPGDLPLISNDLLKQMSEPLGSQQGVRLLTCEHLEPTGYGRVIRRGKRGPVLKIVEEQDASPSQKLVREVALSIYAFRPQFLKAGLLRLTSKNAQNEYYLPDLIALARGKVEVLAWPYPEDTQGVNNLWELATANKILNRRILRDWALRGVHIDDPQTTWVDSGVELSEGVHLEPAVVLRGKTFIGRNSRVCKGTVIENAEIGENVTLHPGCVVRDSQVGDGASLGPYAHLRPSTDVGEGCKIGNFVELKKTKIGARTNIAHLSYLGDAEVGSQVNIGCGFITCNFDGRIVNGERKHKTVIGNKVFMGSDCQAIAPIKIGDGAYIASGSTLHEDVPAGALAIARARQVTKPEYARKLMSVYEEESGDLSSATEVSPQQPSRPRS